MSGEAITYQFDHDLVDDCYTEIEGSLDVMADTVEGFLGSIDSRIRYGVTELYNQMNDDLEKIGNSKEKILKMHEEYRNIEEDYRATDRETAALSSDLNNKNLGGGDVPVGIPPIQITNPEDGNYTITPETWENLPKNVQDQMKDWFKSIGMSDEEIDKVTKGEVTVNKMTIEKLTDELERSIKNKDDYIAKLEKELGFSIRNEDGTIDKDKLAMVMTGAGKTLGMDIDLTPGSEFKNYLNKLSTEIGTKYAQDPTLRDQIKEKYGIDIFDSEGNIDPEKLALVKILDGVDPKDDYNLDDMIKNFNPAKKEEPAPTTSSSSTEVPVIDPVPSTSGEPISKTIDSPVAPPSTPEQPTPTADLPGPTVTPSGPSQPGGNETGSGIGSVLTSAKEGMEKIGGGILDALGKGTEKVLGGIAPYKGGTSGSGSTISTNKATAGILAAAGVAAGGAAAGGGVLISKKLAMLRFTPEDWKALGEDYQKTIEEKMKKVGFSNDEIETFKNLKFKIPASDLKEHTKKIEKAVKENPVFEEELIKLYDFSMIDENHKAIDYLLFITMLIDGKNTIDEYNMYNVINQSFENVDDADYTYTGIYMEDYIDDEEEEEMQILNDPTIPKEEKNIQKEKEEEPKGNLEEEGFSFTEDKDWLKDIGLNE